MADTQHSWESDKEQLVSVERLNDALQKFLDVRVPKVADSSPTQGSARPITSGAVYAALAGKQAQLVSGTNIKTVNNQSILGAGNINIEGSGGGSSVSADEEDITDSNGVLKLKDRTAGTGEKGMKILRKGTALSSQMSAQNTVYVIRYAFDLSSATVAIPAGCVLRFEGGSISNGTLTGNGTEIVADKAVIFSSVTIAGTWNVPEITSAWFNCANDNDLVQAFNLLSDTIQNTIVVEKRTAEYWVDAQAAGTISAPNGILKLKSNTTCVINGVVKQRPHKVDYIHLVELFGIENVVLTGSGELHGEKEGHKYSEASGTVISITIDGYIDKNGSVVTTGVTHEGNHVINVYKCKNVTIDGLTIKDATGDGIDIINYDEDVDNHIVVRNFRIDNCRRQGISVEGNDIIIENGSISNVGTVNASISSLKDGTMPMSAIDIEISMNASTREAKHITCRNLDVSGCYRAFLISTPEADMSDFRFENCNVENVGVACYFEETIKDVYVKDCNFSVTADAKSKTLLLSMSDNTFFTNCLFEATGGSYANDFTLLRTRYKNDNLSATVTNRTTFDGCTFNVPNLNLIKRANQNTTFSNCVINAGQIESVEASDGSRICGSVIGVGASETFFNGWTVEGCEITLSAPMALTNCKIANNAITISGNDIANFSFTDTSKKSYFRTSGNYSSSIVGNQIRITGLDSNILDYYVDNDGISTEWLRFVGNTIHNVGSAFHELPISNKPDRLIARNNVTGRGELRDTTEEKTWITKAVFTQFAADSLALDYSTKTFSNTATWNGTVINVAARRGQTVEFVGLKGGWTFLKTAPVSGESADYATGYGSSGGYGWSEADVIVPSDATYLWLQVNGGNTSGGRKPDKVIFYEQASNRATPLANDDAHLKSLSVINATTLQAFFDTARAEKRNVDLDGMTITVSQAISLNNPRYHQAWWWWTIKNGTIICDTTSTTKIFTNPDEATTYPRFGFVMFENITFLNSSVMANMSTFNSSSVTIYGNWLDRYDYRNNDTDAETREAYSTNGWSKVISRTYNGETYTPASTKACLLDGNRMATVSIRGCIFDGVSLVDTSTIQSQFGASRDIYIQSLYVSDCQIFNLEYEFILARKGYDIHFINNNVDRSWQSNIIDIQTVEMLTVSHNLIQSVRSAVCFSGGRGISINENYFEGCRSHIVEMYAAGGGGAYGFSFVGNFCCQSQFDIVSDGGVGEYHYLKFANKLYGFEIRGNSFYVQSFTADNTEIKPRQAYTVKSLYMGNSESYGTYMQSGSTSGADKFTGTWRDNGGITATLKKAGARSERPLLAKITSFESTGGVVNGGSGVWETEATDRYYSTLIDVRAYRGEKVTFNTGSGNGMNCLLTFLKDDPVSMQPVSFASGYTTNIYFNSTSNYIVPHDAKYLCIVLRNGSTTYTVNSVIIVPAFLAAGYMYFDTNLCQPTWYANDASKGDDGWVDASGNNPYSS